MKKAPKKVKLIVGKKMRGGHARKVDEGFATFRHHVVEHESISSKEGKITEQENIKKSECVFCTHIHTHIGAAQELPLLVIKHTHTHTHILGNALLGTTHISFQHTRT